MKKIVLMLLCVFTLGIIGKVVPVNAQTTLDAKTLKLNNEQANVISKIEEEMQKESYPSYYGGAYISDDSSHVILQIVKENIPKTVDSKTSSSYSKIRNINNNIEIQYVKNSYKELEEINNKLVEYYSSENADISNLGSHYVDVFNNVVVVELLDNATTKVNNLKQVTFNGNAYKTKALDSNVIAFKKGEKQTDHSSIYAGQAIMTKNVPNNCSMGYRVKIGGKAGYLTAGHCFDGTGQSATGGTSKKYKRSGTVDAAFVQTTSSYSPSNSLYYTSGSINTLNNTLCPTLSVNQAIAKAGYKTGYTSGKIKSLNYSGNYSGIYFTGLVATDYVTDHGDSGGAVFVPSNVSSSAGGGAPVAGINKGSSSYGGAFVKDTEIYKAFGFSRY